MRSVRCLTQQDEVSGADFFEKRIVVATIAGQLVKRRSQRIDDSLIAHQAPLARFEARSSNSCTSSSVVWEKSWYQRPTA
jgi:hypothetical protein